MRLLKSKTISKYLFSTATSCEKSALGCSNLQEFRKIMLQTFRKNEANIERIVENQGINSNLYLLSALDDKQIPEGIKKRIINSLAKSDQKMTKETYKYLLQRLPNQTQLHKTYDKPEKQFTDKTTFKINNTVVDTHLVEEGLSIKYQNYDKIAFEKSSHVFDEKPRKEDQRGELITNFKGDRLNTYIRGIISQHQLFYAEDIDQFLFKYNDKLLKHYPSNILFRYVMRSKKYPLEVNLIDLPHIFIMEDICERKSLKQLENTLESANLLNLLCKLKETKNPALKCPKILRNKPNYYATMPDGYYPYLAQDSNLHSPSKIQYMMTKIDEMVKQSSKKQQQILIVLSNQYAPFVRDSLKKYEEAGGELSHEKMTLDSLQKRIMSRSSKLQKDDELGVPLKKSVIAELLFQMNAAETFQYYRSLGEKVAQQYINAFRQYNHMMTLEALDVSAGQKLQALFEKQPPCQLLELIFGNEEQFPETAYSQQTIKKIFSKLDKQTAEKGSSGKIKLNKDI